MKFQRDERQIENEHNSRKAQIDNFFANLKKKVATEKTEETVEKEKHDLKERVRQRVNQFAEEYRHITAENVKDAEPMPFQLDFSPSQQHSVQPNNDQ